MIDAIPALQSLAEPVPAGLVLAAGIIMAGQKALQFRLQTITGPIDMSQPGVVAAVSGAMNALLIMGEALPQFFVP